MATIAAGHAVHDTYTAFVPPLLPAFIDNLRISRTEAGLLYVFLQLPSILQPVIGHLADRADLRLLVVAAPAVAGVTMTLLGWAPSYSWLALLLLVAGLNTATLHAIAPVLAGRLSGGSLGRGMGFWMVGGELGRTLGPLVVVSGIGLLGLAGLPWLALGGIAASAVLFVKLRPVTLEAEQLHLRLPWRRALATMRPVMWPMAGVLAVRACVFASLTIYLPTYLTEEGADLWLAGAALSVLEGAGVAGALVGGWASDRIGRRRVLAIAQATTPLLLFLFLATDGWLRFPLLLLLGFTLLAIGPVILAIVLESFPASRSFANGVFLSLSFAIRSMAVVVIGLVGDHLGLEPAFLGSGVLMLAGLPLLAWLPGRPRGDGSAA
ncbi:MAG: MFS transporter [Candidatus Eiseniibacteriota bacterium]